MNQNRDVFAHFLRTVILVFVLAAAGIGLFLAMLYLRLHPYLIFAALGIGVIGIVYGTARWHPTPFTPRRLFASETVLRLGFAARWPV